MPTFAAAKKGVQIFEPISLAWVPNLPLKEGGQHNKTLATTNMEDVSKNSPSELNFFWYHNCLPSIRLTCL